MPEEEKKEKQKKPAVLLKILKWLWVGLLAILLVAALIFQAPWKVTALLVIFLLAHTALPKPAIKYFWLGVAAVVMALTVWVFLPDETEGWRPYTFDDERAALEAKYAVPDSENAALIYNRILDKYDSNSFYLDLEPCDLPVRQPWSSEEHPQIADWLKTHQPTIDTLLRAAEKENCRFPIPIYIDTSGRVPMMRQSVYLLITSANYDLGNGQTESALEKLLAILKMARHQYQQGTIIDFLVGCALEGSAIREFNRTVITDELTETQLNAIEDALSENEFDWQSELPRFLEGEKLMLKNILSNIYEVNQQGKVRFRRSVITLFEGQPTGCMDSFAMKKTLKAFIIWYWFYMPSDPKDFGEAFDAAFEKYNEMTRPDFDWSKEPPAMSSFINKQNFRKTMFNYRYLAESAADMAVESYYRIHDLYPRFTARRKGCRIIVALRRYKNANGRWPESLDDIQTFVPAETLVDPINGGSFVYRPTEENFTLYSSGKNNIDEDGQYISKLDPNSFYKEITEADDILIWPPKSKKED